jgi:hypothetical protein
MCLSMGFSSWDLRPLDLMPPARPGMYPLEFASRANM